MLQAVLEEGLPAERLILVIPEGIQPAFPNQEVAELVSSSLEKLAVKVMSGLELCGMEVDGEGAQLSALQLRDGESIVTLPCAALVYLHHKHVDQHLFKGLIMGKVFFRCC